MKIFLIRHGESTQNSGENMKQRIIDSKIPLTTKGIIQAQTAGELFKQYLDNENIDWNNCRNVEYISPFIRVKQTEEAFWSAIPTLIKPNTKEDILVAEQSFGLFDSIPEKDWEKIYPNEGGNYKRAREQGGKFYSKPAEGESPYDVAVRSRIFIRDLKDMDYDAENIIIFTHGTTMRCLIMQLCGYTVDWYEEEHNPPNGAIRVLTTNTPFKYWVDLGYLGKKGE